MLSSTESDNRRELLLRKGVSKSRENYQSTHVSRFRRIRQAAMTEETDLTDSGIYCYLTILMSLLIFHWLNRTTNIKITYHVGEYPIFLVGPCKGRQAIYIC